MSLAADHRMVDPGNRGSIAGVLPALRGVRIVMVPLAVPVIYGACQGGQSTDLEMPMARSAHSYRAEAEELRARGWTYRQVVVEWKRRYGFNSRVAFRL